MKNCFILLFCVHLIISVTCKSCFEYSCPDEATTCKKHVKTSDDKAYLITNIHCLDSAGNSIQQYDSQERNTMNPYTVFESTSYSTISGSGSVTINHNNRNVYRNGVLQEFI